ncbi:MAG: alpha/beta hydrolase [Pseudomonadota bacterium]
MIHGRSQGGKDPVQLRGAWVETLRRGFARAELPWLQDAIFDFPYYGDELDRLAAGARAMVSDDAIEQAMAEDPGFDAFLRQGLSEIGVGAGIAAAEIEAAGIGAGLDPAAARKMGPQNWWWVRALARAIDDRLTPMADFTIEAFLRDVYCYLRKPQVAAAIDAIVDAELRDAPTLVIGHSLGSVVAYRLLQRRRALRPLGFVTLGSPLGLRAVVGALGAPENPAGRDGWFNAYDRRDIVALNPLDDAHFPADPEIVNHGDVDNPTPNRHGIVGYLDDVQVARRVAAFARAAGV